MIDDNPAYTPGPWRATSTLGRTPAVESEHDPHFSVAIVSRASEPMWGNARLISAAPELLEALEELVDQAHAVRAGKREAWSITLLHALLAIEKARGKKHELKEY